MTQEQTWQDVAGKCFISHSYADAENLQTLLDILPERVEPVVFARVAPNPDYPVSDGIIPQILECESLIYLKGGASALSFWVSFEKDYALRSGLKVFGFDPAQGVLSREESEPFQLDLQVLYHRGDANRVNELFDWMENERNFQLDRNVSRTQFGGVKGDLVVTLEDMLTQGGPVLWLGGVGSRVLIDGFKGPGFGFNIDFHGDFRDGFIKSRLSGVADEFSDVWEEASKNEDFYWSADPYQFVNEVYARIDPQLSSRWQPPGGYAIDLLAGAAGQSHFNWNRVDDLIIHLYRALLEYRRRCRISPPYTLAVLNAEIETLVTTWDMFKNLYGRMRIGVERPVPRWSFTIVKAQLLYNDIVLKINRHFGLPRRVSRLTHPGLPFEPDFPAHYAVAWVRKQTVFELSMDLDGPFANLFMRRYPLPDADSQ